MLPLKFLNYHFKYPSAKLLLLKRNLSNSYCFSFLLDGKAADRKSIAQIDIHKEKQVQSSTLILQIWEMSTMDKNHKEFKGGGAEGNGFQAVPFPWVIQNDFKMIFPGH